VQIICQSYKTQLKYISRQQTTKTKGKYIYISAKNKHPQEYNTIIWQ